MPRYTRTPETKDRAIIRAYPTIRLTTLLLTFGLGLWSVVVSARPADNDPNLPSNNDVPYGVASTWLMGRQLLADGAVEEALKNLHAVYRTHPDVPQVAWDFQAALVAGGYLQDAVSILDDLVEAHPDSAAFRVQRSDILLKLGQPTKALRDLREARRRGQETLDGFIAEAFVLATLDKENAALDLCRDALEKLPEHGPRLYLTMAAILEQARRQNEIPELLEEAIAAYPRSLQLRDVLMRGLVSLGRDEEALEVAVAADAYFSTAGEAPEDPQPGSLEDASGLPPADEMPSFIIELADQYAQQGQPERAIAILEPMRQRGQLTRESSLWLSRLYLGVGRQADGLATVDAILERWPRSGQGWFLKGRILEGGGQLEEALDYFARGVEYAPDDPQVRMGYVRGMLLAWEADLNHANPGKHQQERVAKVRDNTLRAAELVAPADAENQLVLGYAFRALGMLPEAIDAFTLASRMPALKRAAGLQLSVCHDELDQPETTRAILEELREQFPTDPEVANSLGYFLAEKNTDLDLAESLIREALEQEPGTGAYLDSMGWVKYRKGLYEEAFDYIIQAVNVLPEDPVILEHLGLVLREMGQVAEAEEMLRRALILGGDPERLQEHLKNLPTPDSRP